MGAKNRSVSTPHAHSIACTAAAAVCRYLLKGVELGPLADAVLTDVRELLRHEEPAVGRVTRRNCFLCEGKEEEGGERTCENDRDILSRVSHRS